MRLPGMSVRLVDRLRTLLRVRLFTKILVANSVLVMLAALAGVLAGAHLATGGERRALAVAVPVILAGIALTILVNAIILRLALHPLHQLERAAERVREGELAVRAPRSALADRDLARLAEAFNDALGQRIYDTISAEAWAQWIEHSKKIVNEYRLDLTQKKAHEVLKEQCEQFLFGDGGSLPPDYVPETGHNH